MKLRHKKTAKKVPYIDLRKSQVDLPSYGEELKRIFDSERRNGHCEEYEELTMEEKLLVDADMEFLKTENGFIYWGGMGIKTLERCLARLRKRDRKNDKRN